MKLIYEEIEPGIKIGDFYIGETKNVLLSKVKDIQDIRESEDGACRYTFDNFTLWFDPNGELEQIGVYDGFKGNYKSIGVGSTIQDVKNVFGDYKYEFDVYVIPNIKGICFELGDREEWPDDYWDELTAPIDALYVYKIKE